MNSHFYAVKCLTNMHMGSGDTNFNIIDNEVQKDPINHYPVMHASGIKGALRDYFKGIGTSSTEIENIFGSERLDDQASNMQKTKPGMLKFLPAQVFCMPVQSADTNAPYYLATSLELLKGFGDIYYALTGKEPTSGFRNSVNSLNEAEAYYKKQCSIKIEDNTFNIQYQNRISSPILEFVKKSYPDAYDYGKLLILPHACLSSIQLPILARNQLNNGISKNLWYEEVVPHGTVFCFGVLSDGTQAGDKALDYFHNKVKGQVVQFGGNASIGCGLTKLIVLS